jgi:hypothetical protein
MKKLAVLLAVAVLTAVAVHTSTLKTATGATKPPVIDGAQRPGMIPDRVAYALMLRLISSPKSAPEKRHVSAYVDQIGFDSDADVNALLGAAASYQQRIGVVDAKVNVIKEQEARSGSGRSLATQNTLLQLRAQSDSIADDTISYLSSKLSKDGLIKLRRFVDTRVKTRIKLRSE